jgi:hypothetical protein
MNFLFQIVSVMLFDPVSSFSYAEEVPAFWHDLATSVGIIIAFQSAGEFAWIHGDSSPYTHHICVRAAI